MKCLQLLHGNLLYGLVYFNSLLTQFFTAGRSQKSDKQRRTQSENYFVHQVKSYEVFCAGIGSLVKSGI